MTNATTSKSTTATATAPTAVPTETEAAEVEIDRAAINRTVQILKYKLNELYKESQRKSPLFSESPAVAKARYVASVRSLTEFAESLTRV